MPPIAKVEPITTARALRGPFDYLRPEGVDVGSVLVVPFGHRDVIGVVVAVAEDSELDDERLIAPRRVLDHDLPPELVVQLGVLGDGDDDADDVAVAEGHDEHRPDIDALGT